MTHSWPPCAPYQPCWQAAAELLPCTMLNSQGFNSCGIAAPLQDNIHPLCPSREGICSRARTGMQGHRTGFTNVTPLGEWQQSGCGAFFFPLGFRMKQCKGTGEEEWAGRSRGIDVESTEKNKRVSQDSRRNWAGSPQKGFILLGQSNFPLTSQQKFCFPYEATGLHICDWCSELGESWAMTQANCSASLRGRPALQTMIHRINGPFSFSAW